MAATLTSCPLCYGQKVRDFHQDKLRCYFQCTACALIFADPASFLSPQAEKAVYDLHQNSPDDPGYRKFLSRLAIPLLERLGNPPLQGLDFGAGPGPALSVMLEEADHIMAIYDPFYAPDTTVLNRTYDFVTCTETIEHFHSPRQEWQRLLELVKPGGWLGIMTKLATDAAAFSSWHYKDDPTHVSFFSRETFRYMADVYHLDLEFIGSDVMLFNKIQTLD